MDHNTLSDDQILNIVAEIDKELCGHGVDIGKRTTEVPMKVAEKLGLNKHIILTGLTKSIPIVNRINAAFAALYRKQDLMIGRHIGVFMWRDIFARIRVPRVIGSVTINPFEYVELSPMQMQIMRNEPDQAETYLDQFMDISDVQYGVKELKNPFDSNELVQRFVQLSRLHLHSASAILTGGFDHQGAVQAALLATELGLKAGAAALGIREGEMKSRFGHKSLETVNFVGAGWAAFDLPRVSRVINSHPQYVPNRYSAAQPDRRDVGHLVMGAQYIVSEVVRQISHRDFRSGMSRRPNRRYPA